MKRSYALGFELVWVLACLPFLTLQASIRPYAGLIALLLTFVIAGLEWVLPPALSNAQDELDTVASPWFNLVLRGYVPIQFALMVFTLRMAAEMTALELWASSYALGFVTGSFGITLAHELGHRRNRLDRGLAHLLMASVGYGHFMVEHYRGHHKRVATADDPATAKRGESVYRFWLRTIPGQWLSAWQLERDRLGSPRSMRNLVLLHGLAAIAIPLLLGAWLGPRAAILWIGQAFYAVLLLETVNYIEHYGLQRQRNDKEEPEPVGVQHSWNTYAQPSNWTLVHLQRHSDHHMYAGRPYPLLRALRPAPELPSGYAGSLLLALVPPLWFRAMHQRLDTMQVI